MNTKRLLLSLLLLAGFAVAEGLDPRALTYRLRATTIELDGTTQRLSGDVALVVSATKHEATLTVRAEEGQRDPQRIVLRGAVQADVVLPPSAFPGVEGVAQLRCRELDFDPSSNTVVFYDASYTARAAGDYAGTLSVTGIREGTLSLGAAGGPQLKLSGEALEVKVLPELPADPAPGPDRR